MVTLPSPVWLPYLDKRLSYLYLYSYPALAQGYPTIVIMVTLPWPSWLPYLDKGLPCLYLYSYPALTQGYPTFTTIVTLPWPSWLPYLLRSGYHTLTKDYIASTYIVTLL
jgi:hypothetical protein